MAFFDKIQAAFTQAVDVTGDKIEIQRRKNRIAEEQKKITALKTQLGELVWLQYAEDADNVAEAEALCVRIQVALDMIDSLEMQIEALRKTEAEETQPALPEENTVDVTPLATGMTVCLSCGSLLPEGSCFCNNCGKAQE